MTFHLQINQKDRVVGEEAGRGEGAKDGELEDKMNLSYLK